MQQQGSTHSGLLYKGCEAFWRDVKYAVMARNYQLVKDLSDELARSRFDREALHRWLYDVKCVERQPMEHAALKNTVHHLLGYWKKAMSREERQVLSQQALVNPRQVQQVLGARLPELQGLQNDYLATSRIWTDDPWNNAKFRSNGRLYQFWVHAVEAVDLGLPELVTTGVTLSDGNGGGEV